MYLARHPRLPRLEALKILPEDVSADPEFRQRFAREADIASSLWHPHIVAVHDRGEHDGQLWIAMDYVEGTDAARLVRDRYPHGMPPKDAVEVVSAIADALDYAHERYLLHRDVKPANILLTDLRSEDRRILLADFGIAKAANETHGITSTNMTVGSVAYAAPEQLTGRKLDGRADQYALACTAFHLLAGHQPFAHSNPAAVIGSHLSAPRPRLSSVRPDLTSMDDVLAKGMAHEPYQRFDTCREFATALSHGDTVWAKSTAETQSAFAAAPPPSPERIDPAPGTTALRTADALSSRSAALIAMGIAAVLAIVIVVLVAALVGQDSSPPSTTASPLPTSTWDEREPTRTRPPVPETVTETATVQPPVSSPPRSTPPPRPTPTPGGDLGLPTRISNPLCNGQGIVVLGSVTTPGMYPDGVQRLLSKYPGASYLRTDQSCPSLRPADDEGDPIYAVFRYAGRTESEVRSAVCAAGEGTYGKWLSNVRHPTETITC